jgi:undecaprenyl-diphosphatase
MNTLQAIILGIIEGLTEFLPISSTGHLILASDVLNIAQTDLVKTFEVAIQLGAILAVAVLYFRILITNLKINKRIIVAFLPTAILGLIFYPLIKKLFENNQVVLWSLFLGGIGLIIFEKFHKHNEQDIIALENISYKQAFVVGLAQSISMIPGVSRAAATIVGGRLIGISRKTIVEFSFLLAVPTMLAATALDVYKNYQAFNGSDFVLFFAGFVASFITAIVAVKFFLSFIQNHDFKWFGVYRIILALMFWFLIL